MNNAGEIASQIEELEAASAALLRGLETPWDWAAIENRARALAIEAGAQTFAQRAVSLELMAAARALDAVAQGAPEGGARARERGVWAGAAYEAPRGTELEVPAWNGEFDRWLDWMRAGLENWTPWLWRVAGITAPLAGPRAQKIGWQKWAARWEAGADTAWAARALKLGAPGGRASCAVVGRHSPFATRDGDALALAPLRAEAGRERAQVALEAALREVGGAHCFAGRNLLALREWMWARAGLGK